MPCREEHLGPEDVAPLRRRPPGPSAARRSGARLACNASPLRSASGRSGSGPADSITSARSAELIVFVHRLWPRRSAAGPLRDPATAGSPAWWAPRRARTEASIRPRCTRPCGRPRSRSAGAFRPRRNPPTGCRRNGFGGCGKRPAGSTLPPAVRRIVRPVGQPVDWITWPSGIAASCHCPPAVPPCPRRLPATDVVLGHARRLLRRSTPSMTRLGARCRRRCRAGRPRFRHYQPDRLNVHHHQREPLGRVPGRGQTGL